MNQIRSYVNDLFITYFYYMIYVNDILYGSHRLNWFKDADEINTLFIYVSSYFEQPPPYLICMIITAHIDYAFA